MSRNETYTAREGLTFDLRLLDADERRLINRLRRFAENNRDWNEFDNFWMPEVAAFYEARGLSRRKIAKTAPFEIALDISGRLAILSGLARHSDYRDDIRELIRSRFGSQKAFCLATGISETLLSHVLQRRKNFAIGTLADALARIGYRIRITPIPDASID